MQGNKPAQAFHLLINLIGLENVDDLAVLRLKRFSRLLIGDMLIFIRMVIIYAPFFSTQEADDTAPADRRLDQL